MLSKVLDIGPQVNYVIYLILKLLYNFTVILIVSVVNV